MTATTQPIVAEATTGKLVLFEGPGKDFVFREFPVRPLTPGELLVRNQYTTICGSDLHTYCGRRHEPSPTVLGHEIVGEIEAFGPNHPGVDLQGNPLTKGDRITWTVFDSDPQSRHAQAGIPQKGDNLFKYGHAQAIEPEVFHGGLSEYCILKANTAVLKLPADMPLSVAATLNCSISTVAGALRMAGDVAGKRVLITGMGHLGITCAAMCHNAGASRIVAADIVPKRLADAVRFGADTLIDLNETLRKLPSAVDVVFDMSGSSAAIEFGLASLDIGGTAIWIGAAFNTPPITLDPEWVIRNLITVRGLHNYNYDDFCYALDFMTHNWQTYPFEEAVEKEFPLDKAQEAFAYAIANKPFRVGVKI